MDGENRGASKPVPDNLNQVLNELQMMALRRIESFGWELRFVRRPSLKQPIPVVSNAEGTTIGVLEEDGRVNLEHDVRLRR
ncbi:MAG: hypothetical protein C3F18_02365 [Nitrosomonadales bacterium]|nr:MAG: hypothetical protein C3F18_02365 [Nitrosomonadales bacterium]